MTANKGQIFEFGDFVLDPAERLLLLRGRPLRLTPKTFDLLVALVRHRGHLVSKDQLLDEVWPEHICRRGQSQREHLDLAASARTQSRPAKVHSDRVQTWLPLCSTD